MKLEGLIALAVVLAAVVLGGAGCTSIACSLDPPQRCPEAADLERDGTGVGSDCRDRATGMWVDARCCECYLGAAKGEGK